MSNTDLGGWGRGTWGQGAWGTALPVAVTGVAGTSALGSETATGGATIAVTGVVGTSALDDGTAVQAAAVTGVSAVASTSALGDESVTCDANVAVTTVVGTFAIGTVIPASNNNLNVTLAGATSTLDSVTTKANADITPEGFELTSALNSVNIWQTVGRGITTTYTDVSTTQTPNWQEVA